tara:strand:+ start:50 stop:496 length:447 start_codon:yes stop_codon:yes gene_type:complete
MPVTAVTPMEDTIDLLVAQWNNSNVATPNDFVKHNTLVVKRLVNLRNGSAIIGRPSTTSHEVQPIGNWVYGNNTYDIELEVKTATSRQRLWDLIWEIKRICFNKKHSLTYFQRIQFMNFNEQVDEELSMWTGFVRIQLINQAVKLDTT